jgi:hypothetical protein
VVISWRDAGVLKNSFSHLSLAAALSLKMDVVIDFLLLTDKPGVVYQQPIHENMHRAYLCSNGIKSPHFP